MKKHFVILSSFLCMGYCLLAIPSYAGKTEPDSLLAIWHNTKLSDSVRLRALSSIAYKIYLFTQPDSAFYYAQQEYDFAKKKGLKKNMAIALNTQGISFALRGDYARAIDYFTRELKIMEAIKFKQGIASALGNIGNLYRDQGDFKKAIEFQKRNLAIVESLKDESQISSTLLNIGNIYSDQRMFDKALDYDMQSLNIRKKIDDKSGIATTLNNIGVLYENQNNMDRAADYYISSLKIYRELGNQNGIARGLRNLGNIYYGRKNYSKSLKYCKQALVIARKVGDIVTIKDIAQVMYRTYKTMGNSKQALSMYELYVQMKDSIASEKNQKAIIRQQYKYEYEKQVAADSIKNAEIQKVKDAQIKAQQAQLKEETFERNVMYGGLVLVLLFAGFIFNRFRVTNSQKKIIEGQKDIVEEKNREITDSIQYARRIQQAMLPSNKIIKASLPDSFVFYQPKDIVAGDFYWLEVPHGEKGNILYAAADCTGHGVPGAIVSVLCSDALTKAVQETGITEPGKILDKTVELLEERFAQSEDDVKDGMDVALCSLDLANKQLEYAGANNPLYLVRKTVDQQQVAEQLASLKQVKGDTYTLYEIPANKQPVGRFDNRKAYTNHKIELQNGDCVYIFSDGFADQFGGPNGKKYKYGPFKRLLAANAGKTMDEQHKAIREEFNKWKGQAEQVDDVVIIGVKV